MGKKQINKKQSPYDTFKVIMDKAAGNSNADYQGYGRFWNTLPLEQLKEVVIFGVRMIAPIENASSMPDIPSQISDCCHPREEPQKPKEESCCHGTSASASDHASIKSTGNLGITSGRGAASGLNKGLKGQFPFDSHLPRLPIGGEPVSPTDIVFIEKWIDHGCPEDDLPFGLPADPKLEGLSNGKIPHPPVNNANTFKYEAGELIQRKNAAYLPEEELSNLRAALQQTIDLNKFPLDKRSFNAYAKIHGDSCQHGWEQFLPWHRAYLYEFESLLQDFLPGVSLPYWDWTLPAYNNGLFPAKGNSGIIPEIYRCWISEQALSNLKAQGFDTIVIQSLKKLINKKFNSGAELIWLAQEAVGAKNWTPTINEALYAQLKLTNPLFHRYRFPGMYYQKNKDGSYKMGKNGRPLAIGGDNPLKNPYHHHYPTQDEVEAIMKIDNWTQFGGGHFANQSFGMLSQNPHNTMHIWSGGENPTADPTQAIGPNNILYGDMFNDLVAFYDPIGYGHHSNIDRLWSKWQQSNPGINPDDPTDTMIPWQYSTQQLLNISKLGYEYVKGSKLFSTNNGTAITKFKSQETGLHPDVLKVHSKAEIRLHKVQRSVESHHIRVFINSPDADATTPTRDNDHFVGYISRFGHGDCVGGPGHCDIPLENKRKFDLRPRHHNAPTNHNLDATENIKKILSNGAKDIHINVVALAADGQMATGASRILMDGVSINFMD